jgi:hypothetical protein
VTTSDPIPHRELHTVDSLREVVPAPGGYVVSKELDHLDRYARAFIAASPFVVVSTADAAGQCDASPRGDPAGFVQVLDDRTLFLPERPGNRRIDSTLNMAQNPHVGLLFIVPGVDETLRVNGRVTIVQDEALQTAASIDGRLPKFGIMVTVNEVFFHCARAFLRSRLWLPDTWPARPVPTLGTILKEQTQETGTAQELDEDLAQANRQLY